MDADTVTVYADYACPFCYLGQASLSTYRDGRDAPLDVEWHPFDLLADRRDADGTLGDEPRRDDEYFREAWRNVERLADEYGVPVPDAPITDTDSLDAQQVSLFVRDTHPETWRAFDATLYDAVWRDERDVGDPEVLTDVAVTSGLDADVVDRALADDALRDRLFEAFEAARNRGITGVPTFVSGGRATRGAVSPEQLRRLVEGTD